MSGFNYHTGYIPGVAEEEMLKRRFKIRILLIVSVIALALFWVNKQTGTSVTPAETLPVNSPKNTIDIKKLQSAQPQEVVAQQSFEVVPVSEIEKSSVSTNTKKSESAVEIQNSYEKDIENILDKAFSTK